MAYINKINCQVLRKLKPNLVSEIAYVYVFGQSANEVILITKYDQIYGYGNNQNGCLGLGHGNAVEEPSLINNLCNKQIKNICYGKNYHLIALSKFGHCYSWGYNEFGQLGNGTFINSSKPKLIESLIDEHVIDIGCGANHTLVLTKSGEVYSFGHNTYCQIGNGNQINQSIPVLINYFNDERVVAISCGELHSIVLTEGGKVFSWGLNRGGELGNGNNTDQNKPVEVKMNGISIKKIFCGAYHNLLLSMDGHIYSFGRNGNGQLGIGNQHDQKKPVKVEDFIFTDIASNALVNASIGISENGYCYVWGDTEPGMNKKPKETHYKSINDIIVMYFKIKTFSKPMILKDDGDNKTVAENIINSFNDSKYSDIKFKIENQIIYCHKFILQSRCEHFRSMLSENWSENTKNEIEIDQYSYEVFKAFVKFLYTDCVKISAKDVLDLLDLAHSYFENNLKQKCIEIIANHMNYETVCSFYSVSVKYDLEKLKEICIEFIVNNFFEVSITQSFHEMDQSFQKLTSRKARLRFQN